MPNYIPFHHKYRPQKFADLSGQEAITQTLTNAITSNRIAPAYLFAGVRGTGKTSSARILAKSLNCLASKQPTPNPCGECASCRAIATDSSLDVTELDAASNNGVEQIRELIEKAQFAPLQGRYKVWIIDEAHALSNSATQALLKTLEEPPPSVVFILCTTEPVKLGATIISRCQRFNFRPLAADVLVKCLRAIAQSENIDIHEDALHLVTQLSNGGVRDALTLLEQLGLMSPTVTCQQVYDLVGIVPEQALLELLQAIALHEPKSVLSQVRKLFESGKDTLTILNNLLDFYTNALIAKTCPHSQHRGSLSVETWLALQELPWSPDSILVQQQHLRGCESQIKFSRQPRLLLEVALFGLLTSASAVVSSPLIPTTQAVGESPEQLWQQVIELQTPTLKALLSQHAKLVSFEGNQAQIKVVSSALKPRVEQSLTKIEITWQKVTSKFIKVTLI